MSARTTTVLIWTGAAALVLAGVVLVAIGGRTQDTAAFGWFAYQPLAATTFSPGGNGVFLSPLALAGAVTAVVGLLVAAFAAGWGVARRRSRTSGSDSAG